MGETEARIAIVTETWLQDGARLDDMKERLSLGEGLGMLTKNRDPLENGVAYGGVAVIWKESLCAFKRVGLGGNESKHEVLACAGSIRGHSRKLVVLACYVPPNCGKAKAESTLEFIMESVALLKRKFKDPYLVVAGDFNQWKIGQALEDYVDISEVEVGHTRKDKKIDRIFVNVSRKIKESGTLAPLETEDDMAKKSDHRVAYCSMELPRKESFTWTTYNLSLIHI